MTNTKRHTFFSRSRNILLTTALLALVACGDSPGSYVNADGDLVLPDDPSEEQVTETPDSDIPAVEESTPEVDTNSREAILKKYDHVDPQHVVPSKALADAIVYFDQNKSKFKNSNYISVINFAQSSKEKRFYIIDTKTGAVTRIHVAHGKGSDSDHNGYAEKFSNVSGSKASSLGFYKTAETYNGSNGYSLKLDGLSSTNSRARSRAIVIHGASYVQNASVIQGRSWGCPAIEMGLRTSIINKLKGGSLIYAVVDRGGTGPITTEPSTPAPTPTPTPTPTPSPTPGTYQMTPLAWDTSSQPQRKEWSQYLMKLILNDWSSLLAGASDMKTFCPKYSSLNNNQKANAWAQLFVGMAKYESAYNPLSRMHETTMGTDYVTGKPVYSEGLLQLSYQDIGGYKFCKFDWSKDKNLSTTSPQKTILDPYINLHCGVGIMANQLKRKGAIVVSSGVYWAVLRAGSNKISPIATMVKSLPFCN